MDNFFLHIETVSADGTKSARVEEVETKEAPMRHHTADLQYTATGYGARIPMRYMVKHNKKWRRVYCRIFSNSGTLYITAPLGETIFVRDYS